MRKMRIAAGVLLMLSAAGSAHAADCGLKLIASYDMVADAKPEIVIPVIIAGAPRPTTIDTGSFANWVTESFVDEAKLERRSLGGMRIYGTQDRVSDFVMVPSVDIGLVHQKQSKFMVAPHTAKSKLAAGLGGSALESFDVELDFAAGKVKFFSPDHCQDQVVYWAKSYTVVPFKMIDDQLQITMTLDGHDFDTLLDTGTRYTFVNNRVALTVFGYDEHSPNVKQVTLSDDFKPYAATFNTLSIGGITFPKPTLLLHADTVLDMAKDDVPRKEQNQAGVILAHFPHILLGLDALRQLHLYIAFKEHKIYVTAAGAH